MMDSFTQGQRSSHAVIWKKYKLLRIISNIEGLKKLRANTRKLIPFRTSQEADAAAAAMRTLPLVANAKKLEGLSCMTTL